MGSDSFRPCYPRTGRWHVRLSVDDGSKPAFTADDPLWSTGVRILGKIGRECCWHRPPDVCKHDSPGKPLQEPVSLGAVGAGKARLIFLCS